jgi:hypothetical protein
MSPDGQQPLPGRLTWADMNDHDLAQADFRHVFGMIKGGLSLGKHQQAVAAASSHQSDACSGSPTGTTFKPSILSKSAGLQV